VDATLVWFSQRQKQVAANQMAQIREGTLPLTKGKKLQQQKMFITSNRAAYIENAVFYSTFQLSRKSSSGKLIKYISDTEK